MSLEAFHPAVAGWFADAFGQPTEAQQRAWPAIAGGRHTLLAAPTGSGKTLAAFLAAIDGLVREGAQSALPAETRVLYVSPLKALSNDIRKNLEQPLAGIRDRLFMQSACGDVDIRAAVRTGDTPALERQRMVRQPPHILVTTPESLFILLTSRSGRQMLATVRTVIVDEIHALAGNKRGAHLSLSLERLEALTAAPLVRVGLSATQKPVERMARFLTGARIDAACKIIDTGHVRDRDLELALPSAPLEAIMSNEVWEEVYDQIAALVRQHKTTLVFVNSRRLCERAARHLAERLGEQAVTSHHGSLARRHRLHAEQRLKAGDLEVLVATASLELGIDIGDVDLVCQLGSPRAIGAFLQRVGRSGHAVGATPRGRLFPLSTDDLVECVALLGATARGELDRIAIPSQPLDVLAQQIVAEVAGEEWHCDALYDTLRRAWPYRELERAQFDAVVGMLAQGFSTRRGRRGAHLHHDAVNGRLRARRGARLTAMTNGGAIPDQFDYDVVMAPEGLRVGTLNEDFAFESVPGDIFQLGNTSYRILRVETGKVHVEDAHGEPPNIPFWFGEAPGRTDELSRAVSALRGSLDRRLADGIVPAVEWVRQEFSVSLSAAEQLVDYLAGARAALGVIPTQDTVVLERFFDEAGDMHLVIHAPFGSRLNRAWGLALRKRFCRKFNFELQAAALDDSLVLSLGPTHSFALEEVVGYLKRATVRDVLTQALLDAPMFGARWRWNATIALAVRRNRNGKKVPPQWQRSDAEDLVALVFPDQLACLENIAGKREIPDHPLVAQTIADCLTETMDIDGLERLLDRLDSGAVQVKACDLNGPSPLSRAILSARPYAFLDDAPAEERRTLAVHARRYRRPDDAAELGSLDPAAIKRVCEEAWPDPRIADELHDALFVLGFVTPSEAGAEGMALEFGWQHLFDQLAAGRRATMLQPAGGTRLWVAAERLGEFQRVFPDAALEPPIAAIGVAAQTPEVALREIVRSRLEGLGPVTAAELAAPLGVDVAAIDAALLVLESEGGAVRGRFRLAAEVTEWCDRRLLARIHHYTVKRLRSEIEPVSACDFMRFLLRWQRLTGERPAGAAGLASVLGQLEGFAAPAEAWEGEILPARVRDFTPHQLDTVCGSGQMVWQRLGVRVAGSARRTTPVRRTPITLVARKAASHWRAFTEVIDPDAIELSPSARGVRNALRFEGALFFSDLAEVTELPRDEVRAGLAELVAWGLVSSDAFAGLRTLISPRRRRGHDPATLDAVGRWSLQHGRRSEDGLPAASVEHVARVLLRRYGIVFRKVLEREAWLPPWRELLRVYWRLEARGELRGGRFVDGFPGEQFALPEAVALLREVRRAPVSGDGLTVAASDPLNLTGILLPGERVRPGSGERIAAVPETLRLASCPASPPAGRPPHSRPDPAAGAGG